MTKIDIISGFLGSGKTTLIKKLLQECFVGEQVVLIENEFGEIGIDGGFLKGAGIEIREMNSGCICCSLVGDFGVAMKDVIQNYHPDRIIIEPSGVGKLSDVVKAVASVEGEDGIEINSLVTVVDARKCKAYLRNFGEFYRDQVENARTIILSRVDVAGEEQIEESIQLMKKVMAKNAVLVTTPIEMLGGAKLLEAMEETVSLKDELLSESCALGHHHDHEEECSCGHHHDHEEACDCGHHHDHEEACDCGHHHGHEEACDCGHHHGHEEGCGCGHHHAEEVFASWGCETARVYSQEGLGVILEKLSQGDTYGVILRSKGMVSGDNGQWIYFDMVPGELNVREGEPEYTGRICVIGTGLKEQKLRELFGV